ncbi:hypothetical protein ABE021_09575 [Sporosarcina gallistercoris]|uniref:hypothetical protein n=1 Tax=Sporosarcina gallistercoris TaxID=2762245 RepID=UPI003D2B1037
MLSNKMSILLRITSCCYSSDRSTAAERQYILTSAAVFSIVILWTASPIDTANIKQAKRH